MEIARAADSRIIHKPVDLDRVVEANGPGWTGSLTPARHAYFFGREITCLDELLPWRYAAKAA